MPRLSLRSRYSVVLLVVAGSILAVGVALRPAKQKTGGQLSESEISRVQRRAQQRSLNDMSGYLAEAADRAAPHLLYLKQQPYTATVRDDKAITSGGFTKPIAAVNSRGDAFDLKIAAGLGGSMMQVFSIPSGDRPASSSPSAAPVISPGDWVLAVARNADRQLVFSPGLFQSRVPSRCGTIEYQQIYSSAPLSDALLGGGLFTLDGDLLGVIAQCGGEPVVMDRESIDDLLRRPVPVPARLLELYGLGVSQGPAGAGVQVTAVWSGERAARAGIQPGDVLAAADDQPVATIADLGRFADAGLAADHSLLLFRGKRQFRATLAASLPSAVDAPGGLRLAAAENGNGVVVRSAGGAAAAAGLRAGDLLTAINGQPVKSPDDAVKQLARARQSGLTIALQRDGAPAEVSIASPEGER
jgi:S1-C subfamily serine protease